MTHSRPGISQLLQRGGLSPRRDLGQNFVADPNTVRKIASIAAVGPGDHVLEIGAGLGSLTLALAETGATVVAVEVDPGLTTMLRELTDPVASIEVVHGDARSIDWNPLLDRAPRWTLVANLPYNIATPLVCDLLDSSFSIETMVVMVQREVAQRFVAAPGTKAYGAVSVKVAYWAEAEIAALVPASVFVPVPNVESALVRITRRPHPHAGPNQVDADGLEPDDLFRVVRQAFGQRRKMLRRSLDVDPETFATAGIDGTRRPETLDVADWIRLASAMMNASVGSAASNGSQRS